MLELGDVGPARHATELRLSRLHLRDRIGKGLHVVDILELDLLLLFTENCLSSIGIFLLGLVITLDTSRGALHTNILLELVVTHFLAHRLRENLRSHGTPDRLGGRLRAGLRHMFIETLHASLAQSASSLVILDERAHRAGASSSESTRLATGAASLLGIVLSRVDQLALGRIGVLAGGIVSVLAGAGEDTGTSEGREVVLSRVQISTLVAESSTTGRLHSRSLRLALR